MGLVEAGTFLGATILFGLGIAVIGVVVIFLNNIIHKFWKPLNWFKFLDFNDAKMYPVRVHKEPTFDDIKPTKTNKE
jgi:hypothetical protein